MVTDQSNTAARAAILRSIRERLAESKRHNAVSHGSDQAMEKVSTSPPNQPTNVLENMSAGGFGSSPVEMFRRQLESVGGHCTVTQNETETAQVLNDILAGLRVSLQRSPRIALSDAPLLSRLAHSGAVGEVATSPGADDLFAYDVGITTAQAAIAETGTLVLESDQERHRLVSLLPPVHIAIVNGARLCATLGEALKIVRGNGLEMSRAITFITGPSRTADIELTLTIGVHGPKELHVICENAGESGSV